MNIKTRAVVFVCVAMVAIAVLVLLIARNYPIAFAKAKEREHQARLAELAENGNHMACAFVADRLNDRALLLDMAKNSSNLMVRIFAAEKLNDKALIEESLKQLYKLRREKERLEQDLMEVEQMTDPTDLANWAEKHEHEAVRQAAIRKIDDPVLLAEIAHNIKNPPSVRIAEIENLNDPARLANIARSDRDAKVRQAAIHKINDHAILTEIASNDRDSQTRAEAQQRITEIRRAGLLADIAINHNGVPGRLGAIYQLKDQTLLAKIAKEDANEEVRQAAEKRLRELRK